LGTIIVGKLAKSRVATTGFAAPVAEKGSLGALDGAVGDALRATFQPVLNEPIPDRLQDLIEKMRNEEQRQRG
jgi:hypothetical protein